MRKLLAAPHFPHGQPFALLPGHAIARPAHLRRQTGGPPGADPFSKLFAAQGDIEAFAASAATPLEADLAEAMRFMSAEMLRRQWWYTGHPHRELVNICAELFRFAPYRFARQRRRP